MVENLDDEFRDARHLPWEQLTQAEFLDLEFKRAMFRRFDQMRRLGLPAELPAELKEGD